MEPSSPDSDSNPLIRAREAVLDWAQYKGPEILVGSGVLLAIAFAIIVGLVVRGPETVVIGPPNMETELVYATAKDGQDLGDVGKPHGKSRLEMIALNEALIVENTAKCDRLGRTTGVCQRTMFAGRELAWDALWAGDKPVVGARQVEMTLASTATP